MLRTAKITFEKARRNILFFAFLNAFLFIVFMMCVKYFNMLHITGLRTVNYLILALLSFVQIKRLMKIGQGFPTFLEAMCVPFVTGTIAFFLFAIFLFIYSFIDPFFLSLFVIDVDYLDRLVPSFLVFFEGSGISIIVGLIMMEYADMLAEKQMKH